MTVGDPGAEYGTDNGAEGVLFEETKHAEQFLDGKSRFRNEGGKWQSESNLYNAGTSQLQKARSKKEFWTISNRVTTHGR